MLNGQFRRSYVLWQEYLAPLIVLEFASGNGSEERDNTPMTGKFWVYEQAIRVPFYGIYEFSKAAVVIRNGFNNHRMRCLRRATPTHLLHPSIF
jgi:hypothetical protein